MQKVTYLTVLAFIASFATATHVRAVAASMRVTETQVTDTQDNNTTTTFDYSYTYNTSEPADSDISNWSSGWNGNGVTGWDYVGETAGGASAVYVGDGYVLTAAHVGAQDVYFDGDNYDVISGSAVQIGSSDLTLFQINTTAANGTVLNLPTLTLATSTPAVNSTVVMIGFGNGVGEAWAVNTVAQTNQTVSLSDSGPTSTDFFTIDNFQQTGKTTTSNGGITTTVTTSVTNNGQLVPGDSGGGAFIYNSATGKWELDGINEVYLEDDNNQIVGSGMVQLSAYSSQIEADMAPEPPAWMLALAGLAVLGGIGRGCRRGASRV